MIKRIKQIKKKLMTAKKIETLDGKTRENFNKVVDEGSVINHVDKKKAVKSVLGVIRMPFDYLRERDNTTIGQYLITFTEAFVDAYIVNRVVRWLAGKLTFQQMISTPPRRASVLGALINAIPVDAGKTNVQPHWRWLIDYQRKHPNFRHITKIEKSFNNYLNQQSSHPIVPALATLGTTYALLARHRYVNSHYVQTHNSFNPFYLTPNVPNKFGLLN